MTSPAPTRTNTIPPARSNTFGTCRGRSAAPRRPSWCRRRLVFAEACSAIETVIAGSARQQLVADLARSRDLKQALLRLRERMHTHTWEADGQEVALGRFVRRFDALTRQEGFHTLND